MITNKTLIDDITKITDYNNVKDYLFIRAISAENNDLSLVPHTIIGDLAITYHVLIKTTENQMCSARITNTLLMDYGISLDQLHVDAINSSTKIMPAQIRPLESVILGLPDEVVEQNASVNMYFVTNQNYTDGAGTIFYPELLNSVSTRLDKSLYIIPSSTDECILISEGVKVNPKELQKTLMFVNRTDAVDDNKFLSDTIYHYDKDSRLFEKAEDYQKRMNRQNIFCH